MKVETGKAVGSNHIPMEMWRCLGEEEIQWLTELLISFLECRDALRMKIQSNHPALQEQG